MAAVTVRERRRRSAARRHPGGLTASGARVTSGNPEGEVIDAEAIKRLRRPWQQRAFDYYRAIPEIWYAGQFYSRHMSKVELRAERLDDNNEWVPQPDSPGQRFLNRIHDATGGRSELIGTYGRLRFLVGESYLVCLDPETPKERWECLSLSELRPSEDGKTYKRIKDEGFQAQELREAPDDNQYEDVEDSARVWRLWRRHPEFSLAADGPMRAVMDVCEELMLLTSAVRAQARSRIARSGVLLVPSEISPPIIDASPGEDPAEDTFLANLTMHMEAPLTDEGHPAQLVPLIIRGPAAHLAELRQLQLNVTGDYPEAQLRSECISRLANGLDMPREALLGTADVNHWGAWQIDQQTWSAHVQPVVEDMCLELTSAILRPALEEGGADPDELRRWRIWYDAVKITNHPDRGKDAQDVYDRGALGDAALREAKGFDESDAPTQAELARWIGVRVRDGGLAWYGTPTLKSGGSVEQGTPINETPAGGETAPGEGGTGNDATVGAPANDGAARLLGAAEAALWTCRRTAGSRIVAKDQHGELRGVPRTQIFARLGADKVAGLNGDRRLANRHWLVQGGTEAFEHMLEQQGYPPERVQALAELVLNHAADTLHQTEPDAMPPVLFNL